MSLRPSAFILLSLPLLAASVACAAPADSIRLDIDQAREKVYPALVNISAVQRTYEGGRSERAPIGGSGVIVSPDGVVLTNFHVAGHATRITCTLPSGEEFEAKIVAQDPLTDLSVLRLRLDRRPDPKAPLPFANLGDSDSLQVGDFVLAMGNPLLLSSSMTLGIVSNTHRVFTDTTGSEIPKMELEDQEESGLLTRWIQHDALILPGNSGGPLVDLKGEVVGINELGAAGVGFAIPANIAAQVLKQALANGKIQHGWLGMTVLPVSKLNRQTGALVAAVSPSSPAEKAGLAPGDIVLDIDGDPVTVRYFEEVPLFYQRIAALAEGKVVTIHYLRGDTTLSAAATVTSVERYNGTEGEIRDMGIAVEEITAARALDMRFPNHDGILVTGVRTGYPFESAQPPVRANDVILKVDDTTITGVESFRKAVAGAGRKDAVIALRRDNEYLLAVVKLKTDETGPEGGELPKAWLGVKTQVLTPEIASALKLPGRKGFRITQVYPDTEAAKAGLEVGDLLIALNGNKLDASRQQDGEDLRRTIEDLSVGDKAQLKLLRNGVAQTISVLLEATPGDANDAKTARQKELEFAVRELVGLDRLKRHLPRDQKGVLVTDVTEGGWASMAGLSADDLVLSINGKNVTNVASFQNVLAGLLPTKPRIFQVFVRRGYKTHFVFIEPDWDKLSTGE